jgi:hypothetical protein
LTDIAVLCGGFTESAVLCGGFTDMGLACGGLTDRAVACGGLTDMGVLRGDFAMTLLFSCAGCELLIQNRWDRMTPNDNGFRASRIRYLAEISAFPSPRSPRGSLAAGNPSNLNNPRAAAALP